MMLSKQISLSVLVLMAGATVAFAGDYDSVVDDSVVGYWHFNDPSDYAKDSGGHGSGITGWSDGASGKSDSSRGGGYAGVVLASQLAGKDNGAAHEDARTNDNKLLKEE